MLVTDQEDSGGLRQYTSDFDESTGSIPRDDDATDGPIALVREMERMIVEALRSPSVPAYHEAMEEALPKFNTLLRAYFRLPAARTVPAGVVVSEVREYAGEDAAETLEHALMLFGRSARLANFCGRVAVDGEEDRLLARRWNRAYTSITWSIMALRVVEFQSLMVSHDVAAQPFDDALIGARTAYAATRAAYDRRYPHDMDEVGEA